MKETPINPNATAESRAEDPAKVKKEASAEVSDGTQDVQKKASVDAQAATPADAQEVQKKAPADAFSKLPLAACAPPDTRNLFVRLGFGMRTMKTALAVLICFVLDALTGHNMPLNSCIAALLTMQASQRESYAVGSRRLLGTAIGGVIGLAMLGLYSLLPYQWVRIATSTFGVMLAISICCLIHNQDAAAFTAIVVLSIASGSIEGNIFVFTLWQMVETTVGVVVAVLVNRFVATPRPPPEEGA